MADTNTARIVELEKQVKAQAEQIAQLEGELDDIDAGLQNLLAAAVAEALKLALKPLEEELVRAHARIDLAGDKFKALKNDMRPKQEPLRHPPKVTKERLPEAAWRKAYNSLVAEAREHGRPTTWFDDAVIRRRAAAQAEDQATPAEAEHVDTNVPDEPF